MSPTVPPGEAALVGWGPVPWEAPIAGIDGPELVISWPGDMVMPPAAPMAARLLVSAVRYFSWSGVGTTTCCLGGRPRRFPWGTISWLPTMYWGGGAGRGASGEGPTGWYDCNQQEKSVSLLPPNSGIDTNEKGRLVRMCAMPLSWTHVHSCREGMGIHGAQIGISGVCHLPAKGSLARWYSLRCNVIHA